MTLPICKHTRGEARSCISCCRLLIASSTIPFVSIECFIEKLLFPKKVSSEFGPKLELEQRASE